MLAQTFHDDPSVAGVRIWRRSIRGAIGNVVALLLFVPLVLGMAALGMYLLVSGTAGAAVGVVICLSAVVIGALTVLVWRDAGGKLSASIALTASGIRLDLRAGRSATNTTTAIHELVPYQDAIAVETRFEAYLSLGLAKMLRTFRLTRRNGPPIFLFEERGHGFFDDGVMQPLADEIAQRANVPLTELGMVEGGGGILAAWFISVPDWATPSVSPERQAELWAKVGRTNRLAAMGVYTR